MDFFLSRCGHCGRSDLYNSRRRGVLDRLLALMLLKPVRCHWCLIRQYRPLFVAARPRREHASIGTFSF